MSRALVFPAILAFVVLASCSGGSDADSLSILRQAGGAAALKVRVADTAAGLEKGLSGEMALGKDDGMLFVISQRGPGFWMKDVSFPLSVAFVDRCGAIVDIQDMAANSLEFHDTPHDFRFGLEVNAGWFGRRSIVPGDRLELPSSLKGAACS